MVLLRQPCIRSSTADLASSSELPFRLQGEAGRSIKKSMELAPQMATSGYPACEPPCWAKPLRAASSTAAPPTYVRWPLSPPRSRRGGTSSAASAAANRDRTSPPSGPVRSAGSTGANYLACGWPPGVVGPHSSLHSGSDPGNSQLPAVGVTPDGTDRQHKGQGGHRPHARLLHEEYGFRAACAFLLYGFV
jgi:hypothetical protein